MPIAPDKFALFLVASLVLAITPGPNWLYLIARTLAQGRRAGFLSLGGTTLGMFSHMFAAAFGLSALLLAVPAAYDALRFAGAAYLLWLAVGTIRGRTIVFDPAGRPAPAPDRVLFRQAVLTSVLNPKVALFYVALFPQFIDIGRADVFSQTIFLGLVQIVVTAGVDAFVVAGAAAIAGWCMTRPRFVRAQNWILGSAFGALAAWLALDRRTA
jgi:threonine/homoserine/homoserine lactone efflux protein